MKVTWESASLAHVMRNRYVTECGLYPKGPSRRADDLELCARCARALERTLKRSYGV